MAVSTEVSLDVVVAKLDPTSALDPRTFTVEGANGHPWLKEDLAHLTHATTEKERHDREQGPTMMNPLPPMPNLAAWASPEPPRMRDGAQLQSRHPFIKF